MHEHILPLDLNRLKGAMEARAHARDQSYLSDQHRSIENRSNMLQPTAMVKSADVLIHTEILHFAH